MKLVIDTGESFEISCVKTCDIQPGDLLVLRTQSVLSKEVIKRLSEDFKDVLLPGTKCIVLEQGMDLEIVRQYYAKPNEALS